MKGVYSGEVRVRVRILTGGAGRMEDPLKMTGYLDRPPTPYVAPSEPEYVVGNS
jgi:hypothetical protein